MVYGKTRASSRKFVPAVSQSELSPGKAVSGICAGLDICVAVDTDGDATMTFEEFIEFLEQR